MKLALIGCESRGETLADAAQSHGHTIALCVDASPAAAKRAAARFHAKASGHPPDALNDADGLIFSSPGTTDAAPALRALHAGLHVFWGAPLTSDPQNARSMLDAATSGGAILFPVYPARACPQFAAAAQQATSGVIGKVGFIRVHRSAPRPAATGDMLDALAGDLDWIAANFGAIDTVFAQIARNSTVGSAMLTLSSAKGPIVQCVATSATGNYPDVRAAVELCGETGMIQFSAPDPVLAVSSHSPKAAGPPVASSPLSPPVDVRRVEEFLEAAASGRMAGSQLKHEIHLVRIVESAIESARTGRAVKVAR